MNYTHVLLNALSLFHTSLLPYRHISNTYLWFHFHSHSLILCMCVAFQFNSHHLYKKKHTQHVRWCCVFETENYFVYMSRHRCHTTCHMIYTKTTTTKKKKYVLYTILIAMQSIIETKESNTQFTTDNAYQFRYSQHHKYNKWPTHFNRNRKERERWFFFAQFFVWWNDFSEQKWDFWQIQAATMTLFEENFVFQWQICCFPRQNWTFSIEKEHLKRQKEHF